KGLRVPGWERMRSLFEACGSTDRPGLYISTKCRYTWQTLPTLPRDPRNPSDIDSKGPDHAADSLRYGVLADARSVTGGG
ncbi:MAG: terminase, partial [Gemmatimonadota bacterium]